MNQYEKTLRTDTLLNTGLLAVGIAWIVLAAVQGPGVERIDTPDAGYATLRPAPVSAPASMTAQPASRSLAAPSRVS